jgi:prevent-host-death family protein
VIKLQNNIALSDFQRHTREYIRRMKRTGAPQVLTINAKAEVVVQTADSYQRLLDELDRARAAIGIREALESMRRGEGEPAVEAIEAIRTEHRKRHGL